MRTVDANTGQVTITPITTQKVTKPVLPGQSTPQVNPPVAGGGKSFTLEGGGKKLSEQGQALVT